MLASLQELAQTYEAVSPSPEIVARAMSEHAAGGMFSDSPQAWYEGCLRALERAVANVESAEDNWQPWTDEDRWFVYYHSFYFCYRVTLEDGLYGFAEMANVREVRPESIAQAIAIEPFPRFYQPTYKGCLRGIRRAQRERHQ